MTEELFNVCGIFVFVIGLCIGSFLNVVALRAFTGESIVLPASKCPKCGAKIRPYDNIPVLSWLILGGKCRDCKNSISIQYPIVEFITGIGFLGFYFHFSKFFIDTDIILRNAILLPFFLILFCLAIVISITDIKEKVVLPPNLKKINDEAFYKTFMDGTEVINFPASLEHVGSLAFEGPNGLEFKVIESDATNPPATLWDAEKKTGYPFLQRSNVLIISVPEGAGEAYQNDSFWGKFTIKDPNDEIITVNVKSPGTFYGRLTSQGAQIETTRRLKLLGQLNEDDWAIIKTMNKTYELDLEETDIETISANMIPSAVCSIKLPHNIKSLENNALHNRPLIGTLEIPASCTSRFTCCFRYIDRQARSS